jgi:hypothetical protein
MREAAKGPIGDKIGICRCENNSVKNEIFLKKKNDCSHNNSNGSADQMPSQILEVVEEGHFSRIFIFTDQGQT